MRIDNEEELDERLLQRMQRGDGLAFATLTTRYWHIIHRICLNLLPSASEAREATEEIFLEMSRAPASFSSGAPFKTSLLRVALRRVLTRRRSTPPSGATSLEAFLPHFDGDGRLAPLVPDEATLARMAFNRDLRERIREALRRLDGLDHASYVLREVEEVSVDQTAAVLGIPPESVRRRTHRVCLMLTGYLGELFAVPRVPEKESRLRPQ